MNEETYRLFIAIELAEEMREGIASIQERLRRIDNNCIRWTQPDGAHLTLKFLGNVSGQKVSSLASAMQAACVGQMPFTLSLSVPGVFPDKAHPRVLWVGLEGDTQTMATLQHKVDAGCQKLGFAAEPQSFSPHITLGRVRDHASLQVSQQVATSLLTSGVRKGSQRVDRISLIRSVLGPNGPKYTRLKETIF